jgi:hypothetical protein
MDIVSPDGKFFWDGAKWINTPVGAVQKFMWTGQKWSELPADKGGIIFSPDRSQIWDGNLWIPAPPNTSDAQMKEKLGSLISKPEESGIDIFGKFDRRKKEIKTVESMTSLLSLLFIFFISTTLMTSHIIQPLLLDASLARTGRYALTFDAWDTIENDGKKTIVGIGSSMMQYSLNVTCVEQKLDDDAFVYNLAIPGSMPYLEMIQTEAAIQASPELILLEVGPNSLWSVDDFSNDALLEYFQLRLAILSISLEARHEGAWLEILRESERESLDLNIAHEFRSDSMYADDALEEILRRVILDDSSAPRTVSAAYVPHPTDESWHYYLRTQNWLFSKLELMSFDERNDWENITIPNAILKGVNNPEKNGTRNHEALNYMVSRFSESGIKVAIVSPPLHPILLEKLEPGQYDGHNQTLSELERYPGVNVINLIWEDHWSDEDFFDHNHLDRHGRQTFCDSISPIINEIMGD